jgi:hypothetical protein
VSAVDRTINGQAGAQSPEMPPDFEVTPRRRRLWDYMTGALQAAGVRHATSGLAMVVTIQTFEQWLDAGKMCETKGRTLISAQGNPYPAPWATDESRLKQELGQWLSKLGMTVPAMARVLKDLGDGAAQDDLFSELVGHAIGAQRH